MSDQETNENACKYLQECLKMSMVPLPCQECQLTATKCTNPESIEWLQDLKDKSIIWSRLNEINTSGYKRKLPMSMTRNFDIEIKHRLWSLWGHLRQHKKSQSNSKSYFAITVMALCAARAINLNLWSTAFMDAIRTNGRQYYKNSLKKIQCFGQEFQLEDLDTYCCLEGIGFNVFLKTVQQGCLFAIPLKCQPNLAYALIQFFGRHKFGLLECHDRILGFGYIDGSNGAYFMFDAQRVNSSIFPEKVSAPYLLRTNHLQVLLYCLIVSLNVTHMHAPFCIHNVEIEIHESSLIQITPNYDPEMEENKHTSEEHKIVACDMSPVINYKSKYKRKFHNITREEVEKSLIKPMVDYDRGPEEDPQIKDDFVRIICSDTEIPLMPQERAQNKEKEFALNLLDAIIMGRKSCYMSANN